MIKFDAEQIGKMEFTSQDIQDICGLKRNTLHLYIQAKALTPDVFRGSGTGSTRLFSATNLVEAILITKLISDGIPRRAIISMMASIRRAGDRNLLDPSRDIDPTKVGFFLVFYAEGEVFKHEFCIFNKQENGLAAEIQRLPSFVHAFNLCNLFSTYFTVSMNHARQRAGASGLSDKR